VVITGGTGTLGKPVVRTLLQADRPVTLLVRRPELLSEELRGAPIRVFAGDALDPQAVRRALQGASYALHMATCAGEEPDGVEESMVQGVRILGEAALREGLRRMVFVSSTAALYLGGSGTVTGATAPDPRPRSRPPYARGKIAAEAELRRLQEEGLEGVVLRPAIVLGGSSQHGGLGLWVRDLHCLGWGTGAVPLPLVLARDCAQAIVSSLDAEGIGGRSYLVAGDLTLTAAEFVRELRRRTGRPYRFHPQPLVFLWCMEMLKYAVKVLTRRPGRQLPSWRDLRSRGFLATMDCRDTQRDLGWRPETDRQQFLSEAIGPVPGAER
jgi:nucleoside-diphosphate-sugar epimerase